MQNATAAGMIFERIAAPAASIGVPGPLVALAAYAIPFLVLLALLPGIAGLLTWVERKVAADIQNRVGPNRVGPWGLLQFLADGVKLLLKEDIIPDAADRTLFRLAPYVVFPPIMLAAMVIPFGGPLIVADLNVGVIFATVVSSLVVVGFLMSGWASNNKWALLGGIRSAAQIISYEIPTALSLLTIVLIAGTCSTRGIVAAQGPWPWQWFILHNPFTFVAFFVFFVSALAEMNRTPFDFPEAESELVSGYNVEYSGLRFAMFTIAEFASIFITAALATAVFLGGGNVGLDPEAGGAGVWLLMAAVFMAKTVPLCLVTIWVRWSLPRLRIDQMMSMCWKYFIPISFACLVLTAAWLLAFGDGPLWRRSA